MSSLEYQPTTESAEKEPVSNLEEAKQAMNENIAEYKQKFGEQINDVELEMISLIDSPLSSEEKKEKVVNVIGKVRDFTTGSPLKRVLTSAAAYAMYFGIGTGEAKGETSHTFEAPVAKEIPAEQPSGTTPDDTFDMGTMDSTPAEPEAHQPLLENFKVNIDGKFDLGKAVQDQGERVEIESHLVEQISQWPKEIQEGLANGTYLIKVKAGCSPELINAPIDVGNGTKVDNNHDLSIERMKFGEERVKEAAKKLGMKLSVVKSPAFEDGIDPERPERYVELTVEAVGKGYSNQLLFDGIDGKIEKIYVDASESMKGKVTQLYQSLESAGLAEGAVKIQFGSGFNELSNEVIATSSRDAELHDKTIRANKKFSRNEETFKNANLLFEKMPLVSQTQEQVPEKKVIIFITDEYLSVNSNDISSLEFQERVRNAEAVFMMQNRETQEVTKLTLDDIKRLYEAQNKEGMTLTIDVNQKKLEDNKSVDVKV